MDTRFRSRAPRVARIRPEPSTPERITLGALAGELDVVLIEGLPPIPAGFATGAGKNRDEIVRQMASGSSEVRASGWDPVERIKDQEIDGVEAEVLFPSMAMSFFAMPAADLQQECFRVYNDWVVEYCSHDPRRLYGVGMVSLLDVEQGTRELERVAKYDLRGVMIGAAPPAGTSYASPVYDRFWHAAAQAGLPVALHVTTGPEKDNAMLPPLCQAYMSLFYPVQRTLAAMVFGGVLERFPKLKILSVENDVGWLPHFMYRMDHGYDKWGGIDERVLQRARLPMQPSEYVRRQVFATFQDDPIGPLLYREFGEDNFMWGNDFPHVDSTWPDSRAWLAKNLGGLPDSVRSKIVFDTAVKYFRLNLPDRQP